MAFLARTRRGDWLLTGGGTLMERCRAAGLPVASACDGRGACGRCIMTIQEGGALLAPPGEREAELLARLAATPAQRVGCLTTLPEGPGDLLLTASYW